ncbi:hypothetical protein TIFTF001_048634 [Ficus carica]|uniref:Uncharacterized protein n=1 Tax=Ficus carica TaxID=3494 RepID=A0AA88CJ76_FICCA|nr:hypothetical protein TIFTF001_048634 [Ficus carica]
MSAKNTSLLRRSARLSSQPTTSSSADKKPVPEMETMVSDAGLKIKQGEMGVNDAEELISSLEAKLSKAEETIGPNCCDQVVKTDMTVACHGGSIRPPCTGQSNFQGEDKYFRKHNGDIEKTSWVVVSATVRVLEDSAMYSTVHAFRYSWLVWAGIPQHRDAPDDSFSHG